MSKVHFFGLFNGTTLRGCGKASPYGRVTPKSLMLVNGTKFTKEIGDVTCGLCLARLKALGYRGEDFTSDTTSLDTAFANAKIGDKVYCLRYGWGHIVNIHSIHLKCPVEVAFVASVDNRHYSFEGKMSYDDVTPMLYWDKPAIIVPKRKVKAWKFVVTHKTPTARTKGKYFISPNWYPTMEDFNKKHPKLVAIEMIHASEKLIEVE